MGKFSHIFKDKLIIGNKLKKCCNYKAVDKFLKFGHKTCIKYSTKPLDVASQRLDEKNLFLTRNLL